MKRLLTLALALWAVLLFSNASATIYGPSGVCVGSTTTLHDSSSTTPTWTSSNPTVASIVSSGYYGVITGHTAGTTMITCVSGSGTSTMLFTVSAPPSPISGGTTAICPTTTTNLTCATPGGTWSSAMPSVASVGATSGIVTGNGSGTTTIYYTLVSGCSATHVMTVTPTPWVDSITGPSTVCIGGTATLSSITTGGTWTSNLPGVVSVNPTTGAIGGVTAGTAVITYTGPSGACGSGYRTHWVMATGSTTPGTISGASTVMVGFTAPFYATVGGGTWSSSNPSIATVSSSGVVTGVAPGSAVISYAVSGCSGVAYATAPISVNAANCISGNVLFSGSPYYGYVKVWLIKYNPSTHMLFAVDSTNVISSGSSVAYSFCGMGTDSFRVKAACTDSVSSTTGYQPTYHTASAYWNSATVINHVSGTHDAGKNINMNYGSITPGPGFIAGDVTTGANKGTADPIPAVGLLIYCVDNTSGAIVRQTYTNAAGHYTFASLPVGTYKIYPEAINYATTPYPPITLTVASSSKTAANFEQRTVSMTIVPITTGVNDVANGTAGMNIFPNPAYEVVNISWNVENAGTGTINITDMAGRSILNTTTDMSANSGIISVPVSNMAKGIYLVTVKANGINYTSKIVVE